MNWLKWVQKNMPVLNMRFMVEKPRDVHRDWKGYHTRRLHLWVKGPHARLYVPLSLVTDAGYIDLNNKTMCHTTEMDGAKEKLLEVFKYIQKNSIRHAWKD